MTIEFEMCPTVPPLSWCARAGKNDAVQVRHGAGVETRPEGFVEGAWDGGFDAFDFDLAETLAGTGGRLREGRLVFAAPFHPLERLFVLRRGSETLVSNSLAFLLAEAADSADLAYPNYFFDLVRMTRRGIAPPPARLRTASGAFVELFPVCNLTLGDDGELRHSRKPIGPPPSCYADYFAFLDGTAKRVAENALAPGRRRTYRLVAACSRGYDSAATAALAALAGGREGVTFLNSGGRAGHPITGMREWVADDSGADSLRALGMNVAEYQRADVRTLTGFPTAEFFLNYPFAVTDAQTRPMEDVLRGSLFVSGRHGERYWGPTSRCARRDFREVDDCILSGQGLGEFRLRAGFLHFPVCYAGALHGPAIYRITRSPEMRPWKLGVGYYDRPIARRIAEEAGVPRENFGHEKFGADAVAIRIDLNPESERDFQQFLQARVPPSVLSRLDRRHPSVFTTRHRRLAYVRTQYAHLPLVAATLDLLGTDRFHRRWNSISLYQFHWGLDKIQTRYRI